ncbi:probable G-protein coupled receptor 148 isoform X1 [Equus quagga]|uniref:probable G-protein coupled receptor 148 isoform X1 n=2 Tax=Equus quagga TaxID=89248 RepID=UPI001EE2D3A3|nr:probable G-protein coupled receptor 148 isoform X1 [Equus quagga]
MQKKEEYLPQIHFLGKEKGTHLSLTKGPPSHRHTSNDPLIFSCSGVSILERLPVDPQRSQVALKIMNLSSEHCNISDWLRLEATVKASLYVVSFSFATFITVVIIAIVTQNSKLRNEVRYILLCHHLLCISSYCGLGVVFQGMRALLANSPVLMCWVVFGAQLSVGEGILFTLAFMAFNTYLAICWPLKSLSFVDSVKYRILAGTWMIIILKNICLFLIESSNSTQAAIFESEPLCPVVLNGTPARAIGMAFLFLPLSVILISYSLIYQEGKRAGHFNRSNIKARRTVLIHLVQLSLHVIPTLLFIGLGKMCGAFFFALNLVLFGVFAFAQCFNPLIYGLWNRELQSRLYHWVCCRLWCGHVTNSRGPV